ncbi:right-handed parallel beta-helix repeat-containing protein [Micromonospora sp. M12]
MLEIQGCHRLKVLGLKILDSAATWWYKGLEIRASTGIVVDGVVAWGFRHTGIAVWDDTPGTSNDILITNCTTEDVRLGISSNGHDVRITNNHVAMDWLSSQEAKDWGGVWRDTSKYYDGISVFFGADRTVVSGNTITECGQAGIYVQQVTNLVVADNTVKGCQLRGIEIDGSARGEKLPRSGLAVGVAITGNVVTNCVGHINLIATRDVTVVGNRVENPNSGRAVSCIAIHDGTIKAVVVGNHVRQAHRRSPRSSWKPPRPTSRLPGTPWRQPFPTKPRGHGHHPPQWGGADPHRGQAHRRRRDRSRQQRRRQHAGLGGSQDRGVLLHRPEPGLGSGLQLDHLIP